MFPARYLPRFRAAIAAQQPLKERESWSRGHIEQWQLDRLNRIWSHAVLHVPYYRQMAAARSLPQQFASLQEYFALVPLLPRSQVRDHREAFLSEQAEPGRWHRTGGSTGAPLSIFWPRSARLELLRTRYRFYGQWSVDIFDRMVFLWGHAGSRRPGLTGRLEQVSRPLVDRMRNRLRLSAYQLEPGQLREHLRRIERFQPAAIYGYSSALYLLAQQACSSGFSCPSIKAVIMTAEPARPHYVETIERAFDAPAIVEYGSIESVLMAGEAPDRTLRVREDVVLLETLPRTDGRQDIVVTLLANTSFPLLRYAIEDVTDASLEFPAFGFAKLHNVSGRDNDILLTRSGRVLHPAEVEALFTDCGEPIRRFFVHQHADSTVTACLEVPHPAAFAAGSQLQASLTELLEGIPVQFKLVQRMPTSQSGKHRHVISDLASLDSYRRNWQPAAVLASSRQSV